MPGASLLPRIRLVSGLVLMVFAFMHLVDAALGLLSIAAMERAVALLLLPWQTPPGLLLLYGALAVHVALGLASLVRRRPFSATWTDVVQVAAGIAIPILLIAHLMATRVARTLADFEPSYAWILAVYWRWAPNYGLQQVFLVAIVWVHGCIGLLTWLRLKPWWPKVSAFVYPPVFLLPILALLAFVRAGDEALMRLDGDPAFHDRVVEQGRGAASIVSLLQTWQSRALILYALVAALAFAPLLVRILRRRLARPASAEIRYVDGPTVASPVGVTLLDVSRRHGVPHSSACAGHARCGTCRVRVDGPADALMPVAGDEALKLAQLGAGGDIRLACRAVIARPAHLVMERLVPVEEAEAVAQGRPPVSAMAGATQ
jgi:adenylate cyclase